MSIQGRREGGVRGAPAPPELTKIFTNNDYNDSILHWNVLFASLHKRQKNFSIGNNLLQHGSAALTNKQS